MKEFAHQGAAVVVHSQKRDSAVASVVAAIRTMAASHVRDERRHRLWADRSYASPGRGNPRPVEILVANAGGSLAPPPRSKDPN